MTAAQNYGWESPGEITKALDVVGINYAIEEYDHFHDSFNASQPLIGSETSRYYYFLFSND